MATEPQKMLGAIGEDSSFLPANFRVSAQCNRVPVMDGHTLCIRYLSFNSITPKILSIELEGNPKIEAVSEALKSFQSPVADLNLPSAPKSPIHVHSQPDHPQPRSLLSVVFLVSLSLELI